MPAAPVYKRILLKLSGEALMGEQSFGIEPAVTASIAADIAEIQGLGVEVGVVIGGGNIFRGVAVCRGPNGWSAPAYLNLGGGSFGLQIGVESTDYVMLFMTPESARSLLNNNIKLGAGVSVAAGPVGREAGAATDLALNAQILSYSRSKGLFAGAALEGAVIETANDDMEDVYGPNVTAREVLFGGVKPPAEVTAFAKTLETYSPAMASTSGTK